MNKKLQIIQQALLRPKPAIVIYFLSILLGLDWSYNNNMVRAENAGFIFQGSVGGVCEFNNIISASLGLRADGRTFDSKANGGSPASATLFCNQRVYLKVDAPEVFSSSEPITVSSSRSDVALTYTILGFFPVSETITATNDSPSALSSQTAYNRSLGNNEITVNMEVTSDTEITAGTYLFTVRLTVVP